MGECVYWEKLFGLLFISFIDVEIKEHSHIMKVKTDAQHLDDALEDALTKCENDRDRKVCRAPNHCILHHRVSYNM